MTRAAALEGRVAIVTGAGRGIGRSVAGALAVAGCRLALCSRTDSSAQAARELSTEGIIAHGAAVDISRPDEFKRFVDDVLERFGTVDILVNNAAVNCAGSVADMSPEAFDSIYNTNVRGVFFAVQAVLPTMIARRYGKIVNVGSFVGRTPAPYFTAYSASKAAVLSLTRGFALELSEHDINVNAVCPGNVWSGIWESSTESLQAASGMTARELFDQTLAQQPFLRPQTGAEIAAATVFLCTDDARNITGEALFVSGGL